MVADPLNSEALGALRALGLRIDRVTPAFESDSIAANANYSTLLMAFQRKSVFGRTLFGK